MAELGTVKPQPADGHAARVARVEHARPEYARSSTSAPSQRSSVRAVFYVQLGAGGKSRVRVDGRERHGPRQLTAKSGSATVTIGRRHPSSPVQSPGPGRRWDVRGCKKRPSPSAHDAAYWCEQDASQYGYLQANAARLTSCPAATTRLAR